MKPRRLESETIVSRLATAGATLSGSWADSGADGEVTGGSAGRPAVEGTGARLVGRAARLADGLSDPRRHARAGRTSPSSRTTFSPMTARMAGSSRPASRSAWVSEPVSDASNGTGTAPSQSEPSATCSAPTRSTASRIARATSAVVAPHVTVSQNPIPRTPPVAATPSASASVRLRPLSHVRRRPVCEARTGRVAAARMSAIVAATRARCR